MSISPSSNSFSAKRESSSSWASIGSNPNVSPKHSRADSRSSHLSLDQMSAQNMQVKASNSDVLRVSVSSAPSTSSHGSAPDDYDALGDVYIWGEVICDNVVRVGPEKNASALNTRTDILLPRPLESEVVLDVNHIACGVRHGALVTRQGEVFTWGEESGGRLGHGVGKDVTQPRLVESLSFRSVDFVACGEFHTCAVTMDGELYTWGDGTHNAGVLGHGSDVSHWIPKRVSGPLEGLQVSMISCGPWHSALITSTGQLFTYGDGTFGVLGHGDRETVLFPREVASLSGLRTVSVACGVWHTAAVVEVIVTQSSASVSSGKLFTWGDGDKNRLGHGDKEPRLQPTCVPALIDYTFHKIACGHCLTVGLTTSGHVFTMGSTVYGQLGNPNSDGKLPCLVEDKLTVECVEEIACGSYHVAVLTSRNEVYTWGKGANGRLGHGDIEDRKTPTLVETFKDRLVKYIACGSNYTAAICLHKCVSVTEQSQCSACRQAFGFTRKRHNCYNCGLVHCHACSSRKAVRAALAPNPSKPYRVCDSCFTKLSKVAEAGVSSRRNSGPRLSGENKDRLDKGELRLAKLGVPSNLDLIKQLDYKAAKQGKKTDTFSLGRSSQALSSLQLKDVRSVSPFSRKSSPPRSATPIPTTSGLSFSKSIADSLKKNNELLNQEIHKLRAQVENLRHRCELQELDLQKSTKNAQEAMFLAAEESAKCKAAKEVIKSLTSQLKDMAERLPPGTYDAESFKLPHLVNGLEPSNLNCGDSNGEHRSRFDSVASIDTDVNGVGSHGDFGTYEANPFNQVQDVPTSNGGDDQSSVRFPKGSNLPERADDRDPGNGSRSRNSAALGNDNQIEAEWIEQYEPGVYITLVALREGTRDLKRVRFSRRRFGEHQAESWWSENRENVYKRYNVRGSDMSSASSHVSRRSGPLSSPSQS
ncbi:PREDICTED: uncharacterized protein LOC109149797 [Ipomoea nil]|uniref:uncharacterized protein LOC109149797 n=1 Tax=Ipomoea nil TaxID=35883 RepID=UPI00090086C8|nr:PREDICTED: uncharacterized protein LOC109149797 [Ipomoea nil]